MAASFFKISAGALLQTIDGRVFAVTRRAHFRLCHRAPHRGVGFVTVSLRKSIIVYITTEDTEEHRGKKSKSQKTIWL